MRKWLKRCFPNHQTIQNSSQLGFLKKYLRNPELWHVTCSSASRGVAIGIFIGMLTVLPMQMLIAAIFAIFFRANLPLAVGMTWIANPFTIVPITYLSYFLGKFILGLERDSLETQIQPFNWHANNFHELWHSFATWILQFGKAYFIGLPFVAVGSALLGYFAVILFYYFRSLLRKNNKKLK